MRIVSCALLLLGPAWPAVAADTTVDEMSALRSWVAARFEKTSPATSESPLPFSFTYGGTSSAGTLASWPLGRSSRKLDEQRTERVLTCKDAATGLVVRCTAIEYTDLPAVEWVVHFTNTGREDTPIIEDIRPLDLHVTDSSTQPCVLHYSLGDNNSGNSFAPVEKALKPDDSAPVVLAPKGGRSSDGYMPFFNLQLSSGGYAVAIGWSGQWEARFQRVGNKALIIHAGQQLTHFTLHPGETVRTPRILMVFWQGKEPLRGNNLLRRVMMSHYLPRRDGTLVYSPICASVNWTEPDGTYEGPHVSVLPALARRGVEVFWSDMDPQQWYPLGFPNGTGTWEPDPAKYPHGLKPIGDAVRAAGMDYLLWFEPERVHPGTRIDKKHPEWVMKPSGEWSQLFALHDPAARRWLTHYVDVQIVQAQLKWLRWDFNIEPLGFWRRNDAPDRKGITEIRHVEGLYAMWDDLRARHPGLVIDNCASGGRRIDLESCVRGIPLWHSDMQCSGKPGLGADQLQNAGLFRWIPMHGCGTFAYEPSYEFRSAMTAGNLLCSGNSKGRLNTADADTVDAVKRTVAIYKKIRPFMLGDFYPLFPHDTSDKVWFGYQFHRPDLDAGMAILFRRKDSPDRAASIRMNGADPTAAYEITCEDDKAKRSVPGSTLASLPVEIDAAPGSAIVYYRRVSQEGHQP